MAVRYVIGLLLFAALAMATLTAQSRDAALVAAVKNRNMTAARALLARRLNVNTPDVEGMTALHWAAHWDDLETVKLLLSAGAKAEASNRYGVTPLHEASTVGNVAMVEALLKAGANPNAGYGAGETPLMTAARTGNTDIVKLLIAHGAEVNAAEEWRGQTAVMWAAVENHAQVARLLIEHGANVNARSTVFNFDAVDTSSGGVIVDRPMGGLTVLFFAARSNAIDVAKILLANGADTKVTEPQYGYTPLQTAINNGHWDFAALLIENGADVNDGSLYTAIETRNTPAYTNRPAPRDKDKVHRSIDIIGLLLARGANPNQVYEKKIPPRQAQGEVNVPAGATPLYRAVLSTDMESVRVLMMSGANPSIATKDGSTPLMAAAGFRAPGRYDNAAAPRDPVRLELVRTFIDAGARIDAIHRGTGNTAMHYAAQSGANRIVDFLTAMGARRDIKNKDGRTPLDLAAPQAPARRAQ